MKILRKLKKDESGDGKFIASIRYGLGEIGLLVVGILFAIQIDDWQGEATLNQENQGLLLQLTDDLKDDKQRFESLSLAGMSNYISLEEAISNCDSALAFTYKGLDSSSIYTILGFDLSAGHALLLVKDGAYSELLNTAKLYTVGSDSLVMKIKDYYTEAKTEDYFNKANSEYEQRKREQIHFWARIKRDRKYSKNFSLKNYPWLFDPYSEKYVLFQDAILEMRKAQGNNYTKFLYMRDEAEKLINAIQKELE